MSNTINNQSAKKIYSNNFVIDVWGPIVMEIEDALQDIRDRGFTVECKSQAIGERGFLFKKTIFEKDITISGTNEKQVDIISKAIYDTICSFA